MARFCARVRKRPDLPIGVDEGHLPAPHDQQPGGGVGARRRRRPCRADHRSSRRRRRTVDVMPVHPSDRAGRHRAGTLEYVAVRGAAALVFLGYSYLAAVRSLVAGLRRGSPPGSGVIDDLPAVGAVRRRAVRRRLHPADPGQVGPGWSVEAAADPHLELGLRPLLGGEDAGPGEPAGLFAGSPLYSLYLRASGCESRAGCRDLHPARAGVHRSADHRRRDGHPEGIVPLLLPGARRHDPDRARSPSAGTFSSARRPCWTSTPRWATGRNSATPRRCTADRRCRTASGGTGPRQQPRRWTTAGSRPTDYGRLAPRQLFRLRPCSTCSSSSCRWPRAAHYMLLAALPSLSALLDPTVEAITLAPVLQRRPGPVPCGCSSAAVLVGLLFVFTVPRVFNRSITPDKVYPLYGFHYSGPPCDHPHDQHQILHASLREQLLHRALSAQPRVSTWVPRRADRVELRLMRWRTRTRTWFGRQRNDGR